MSTITPKERVAYRKLYQAMKQLRQAQRLAKRRNGGRYGR
jgi:hypothetical protein